MSRDENFAPTRRVRKPLFKRLIPIKFDRYLVVEVLAPFLGGVVFFTFILLMFQMLRLASAMIEHSVPFIILMKIVWYMIVTFMPIVLPLAFLISVLVAFGRLSGDSELVAMKANGVSIFRLAVPVLVVSLFVSATSLGLNMTWAPEAKFESRATLIRLTNTSPISTIRESTFTTGFFGLLIYAENVDTKTDRLRNIFIYDERDPKAPRSIIAPAGQIVPVKQDSELGASITLKLYDGEIHSNNTSTVTYEKTTFHEYKVHLTVGEGANSAVSNFLNFTYADLKMHAGKTTDPMIRNQLLTEIYARWFTSLLPVIFTLIGIGFGTARGRAAPSSAGLVAIMVILPVYLMQVVFQNWGYSGALPPFVAMLIPDLVLLGVGIFAFRKTVW
jgi:lipopolysaccharide export system permease protein